MEEYVVKQLEDQTTKLIDSFAEGKLDAVERRFKAIENFILRDNTKFKDGIKNDLSAREADVNKAKKEFVKELNLALEQAELDDQVLNSFKAFEILRAKEQAIMDKYGTDLVESVVSFLKVAKAESS